jgi:hypothetical protein
MLRVQMTKRPDGGGVLRCARADGSITWQKQNAHHAPFFALHDLTHFAVEQTLGLGRGFFGLIAEGWDMDDLTGKGTRGPLPGEAAEVEYIVGAFDTERAGATILTAAEFNEFAARFTQRLPAARRLGGSRKSKWRACGPDAANCSRAGTRCRLERQSSFNSKFDFAKLA